jgi:hypothetical protein
MSDLVITACVQGQQKGRLPKLNTDLALLLDHIGEIDSQEDPILTPNGPRDIVLPRYDRCGEFPLLLPPMVMVTEHKGLDDN